MYQAFITKITNVRPHSNADRLKLADCFGNTVIIPLHYEEGMLGVYFPTDGQLSEKFAKENNLLRSQGGYLDDEKRNIRTLKLRKEPSDGLFLPLTSLEKFVDITTLKEGDAFYKLGDEVICQKYYPIRRAASNDRSLGRLKKTKVIMTPDFREHIDTAQFAYNLHRFAVGMKVDISLKVHGTSARTGNLPHFVGYKKKFLDWILFRKGTPIYDYRNVTGTRRVERGTIKEMVASGYAAGNDGYRVDAAKLFEGKLHKGETVYYEIAGFDKCGGTIMPIADNKKSSLEKDFIKRYGEKTVFTYGCEQGQHRVLVYRISQIKEDGLIYNLSTDECIARCAELGVEFVPVLEKNYEIEDMDKFIEHVKELSDGPDILDPRHIREGVVVKIVSEGDFDAYKEKNFTFKVISGIALENASLTDMTEEILLEA